MPDFVDSVLEPLRFMSGLTLEMILVSMCKCWGNQAAHQDNAPYRRSPGNPFAARGCAAYRKCQSRFEATVDLSSVAMLESTMEMEMDGHHRGLSAWDRTKPHVTRSSAASGAE